MRILTGQPADEPCLYQAGAAAAAVDLRQTPAKEDDCPTTPIQAAIGIFFSGPRIKRLEARMHRSDPNSC